MNNEQKLLRIKHNAISLVARNYRCIDEGHVKWIRDRLVHYYGVSENMDYILALDEINVLFDKLSKILEGEI